MAMVSMAKPCCGHQARFHAAFRTQPHHRHVARAQRMRNRQAREDMAAGAAGHDHHRMHGRGSSLHAEAGSCVGSTRLPPARRCQLRHVRRRLVHRREAGFVGTLHFGALRARCRRRAVQLIADAQQQAQAAQVISTLEPPDEINGRVRPLVGRMPRFTPIDTKACRLIHRPRPNAQ